MESLQQCTGMKILLSRRLDTNSNSVNYKPFLFNSTPPMFACVQFYLALLMVIFHFG